MIYLCIVTNLYLNIYPILGQSDQDYYLAELDNKEIHLLEVKDLHSEKEEDPLIPKETPLPKEKIEFERHDESFFFYTCLPILLSIL